MDAAPVGRDGRVHATPFTEETDGTGLARLVPLSGIEAEHASGVSFDVTRTLGPFETRWDPLALPVQRPDGRWTVDAWAPLDGRVINGGVRISFKFRVASCKLRE